MEFAASCDIIRNNNPKSKRFGQHGIVFNVQEIVLAEYFRDNGFNSAAVREAFFFDLFAVRQNGFGFAEVNYNIPVGKSPYQTGSSPFRPAVFRPVLPEPLPAMPDRFSESG